MQTVYAMRRGTLERLDLPAPEEEVLPGVPWGRAEECLTPAYWASQVWMNDADRTYCHYRLGATLIEEVAACLLGGHGIPAEVGLAAYERLRDLGLLASTPTAECLEAVLREPLIVKGRQIRYRFARQKAAYLSTVLVTLHAESTYPQSGRALRGFLLELPGIGPKTASWITRNWLESDEVAILDIHILRAGAVAGFFPKKVDLAKTYFRLEENFLAFASAISCRASVLDNFMWHQMRQIGHLAVEFA